MWVTEHTNVRTNTEEETGTLPGRYRCDTTEPSILQDPDLDTTTVDIPDVIPPSYRVCHGKTPPSRSSTFPETNLLVSLAGKEGIPYTHVRIHGDKSGLPVHAGLLSSGPNTFRGKRKI